MGYRRRRSATIAATASGAARVSDRSSRTTSTSCIRRTSSASSTWSSSRRDVMHDESGRGVAMAKHAVVIVGGGPTGLMLAGELALSRVDVAIVERRATQDLDGSRAGGLHARTIEVLDQRGIADRFLSQG